MNSLQENIKMGVVRISLSPPDFIERLLSDVWNFSCLVLLSKDPLIASNPIFQVVEKQRTS
jgi:hypothetical protein